MRSTSTRPTSLETRARLIAAAIECIGEMGYANATTPLIAERAGVSRGALQYHFDSRADLVIAVIDEVAVALNFGLDVESLQAASLEQRVDAVIDRYWQGFGGPLFRAALNVWLAAGSDEPLAQRLKAHVLRIAKRSAQSWRELFADTPRSAAQLAAIRRLVMSTVRGYAVMRIFESTPQWKDDRAILRRLTLSALRDPAARPTAVPTSRTRATT